MRIAVLSGKGGTGKTFVSVNLSAAAEGATYIDCDVEEPNGRLFFDPQGVESARVYTPIPSFDGAKCTGCRKCLELCRFNALVYVEDKPKVFPLVCHSCGGCALVCPAGAVREIEKPVGSVESGVSGSVRVVTGVMDPGEASGIPVIKAALARSGPGEELCVIDCPPGSACAVMESVQSCDYCVLVAEPTAFGLHNFQMVRELAALLGKPCGVVINKDGDGYAPLEELCRAQGLKILCRIPYRADIAALCAQGAIAVRQDEAMADLFRALLADIRKEASV